MDIPRHDIERVLQGLAPSETQDSGAVVDGDHCSPHPCRDAVNAETHLMDTGVIIFHDFIGRPVQEGVEYLMGEGFNCRVYWTPHMVACCWRGDFTPPDYVRDPQINWEAWRARHHAKEVPVARGVCELFAAR
jgi:hypothetical protein